MSFHDSEKKVQVKGFQDFRRLSFRFSNNRFETKRHFWIIILILPAVRPFDKPRNPLGDSLFG